MKNLIAFIALAASLTFAGCGTLAPGGAYNGDKALYVADSVDTAAYVAVHDAVLFEYQHRAELAPHPEIKKAADELRVGMPKWSLRYDQARDLYSKIKSPETKAAFDAAFADLKANTAKAVSLILTAQSILIK